MKKNSINNDIDLEDVQCNVCASSKRDYLFNNFDRLHGFSGEFKINRCLGCGLVYISPRPKNIGSYYVKEYEPYILNPKDFHQSLTNNLMKAYYSEARGILSWPKIQIYKLLYNPIPSEYKGKKILDIGCGNGMFLYNLKKFGKFHVYGIDTSSYVVDQAKTKLGLENISVGTLERNTYPDNFFDVITLNHVIEHLPNPKKNMVEINRILKKEGLLMIITPNSDSLGLIIFKKFWFALETPRHLNMFSAKTLSKLTDSIKDFKIEKIDYRISNLIFIKSLIYTLDLKNEGLIKFLMSIKIFFLPIFYLIPKKRRDIIAIHIKKI